MATQGERRERHASRCSRPRPSCSPSGRQASSVDAIAERAGRTSGAIYDHFGGKDGLLFALLEGWVDDVAAVIRAELTAATTLEERMAAMWRNIADPAVGDGRWIRLEHELWSYAARDDAARERLARRYRAAWNGIDERAAPTGPTTRAGAAAAGVGPAVIGLLLGLEMMRRIDPDAVADAIAVGALLGAPSAARHAGDQPT